MYAIKVCEELEPPQRAFITYSNDSLPIGTMATYECGVGLVLAGETARNCTSTGWDGEDPSCGKSLLFLIT